MRTITAGPGDPITWGPYTGHPHDPRAPEPEQKVWSEDEVNDVLGDFLGRLPAQFEQMVAEHLNETLRGNYWARRRRIENCLIRAFWKEIERRDMNGNSD